MKKNKQAFTLIELMAVIAILSIVMVMVSSLFLQAYKIFNKTENNTSIENQFRNAVLIMQNSIEENKDNVIIEYTSTRWNIEGFSNVKPLLGIISDSANTAILYVQAYNNTSQTYEMIQLEVSNEEDLKSSNVSLSLNNSNVINNKTLIYSINVDENNQGVDINFSNDMITVSATGIISKNTVSNKTYSSSISTNLVSNIVIGTNGEAPDDDTGESNEDDNSYSEDDTNDNKSNPIDLSREDIPDDVTVTAQVDSDWGNGAKWYLVIKNNGTEKINGFNASFNFKTNINKFYSGEHYDLGNNRYTIQTYQYYCNIEPGKEQKFEFASGGMISRGEIISDFKLEVTYE